MLRQRYSHFLDSLYRPHDIYAVSSEADRTKMSLQLMLAGLYPPDTKQMWNSDLPWLAIPTHYVPKRVDMLLKAEGCSMLVTNLYHKFYLLKIAFHQISSIFRYKFLNRMHC